MAGFDRAKEAHGCYPGRGTPAAVVAAVAAATSPPRLPQPHLPPSPAWLLQYRELFDTPVERLLALRDALVEQMEAGLDGKVRPRHRPSPLLRLAWPVCVLNAAVYGCSWAHSAGCCILQEGGLMMLPSYVDVLPSGRERGDCYAIDLGGTNLRVGGWVGGRLAEVVLGCMTISLCYRK